MKLAVSIFFATIVYFIALLIATVTGASVGVVFAFLLAILIIEDRIRPLT